MCAAYFVVLYITKDDLEGTALNIFELKIGRIRDTVTMES